MAKEAQSCYFVGLFEVFFAMVLFLSNSHPMPNLGVDFTFTCCPRVILHAALSNQKNNIAPLNNFWYPPFTPHYDILVGELYFSPRRGCPRVL